MWRTFVPSGPLGPCVRPVAVMAGEPQALQPMLSVSWSWTM
jgi:hypothetical protein